MPVYEYICKTCNTQYEVLVPLDLFDKTLDCQNPKCKSKLKRQMSAPVFKI